MNILPPSDVGRRQTTIKEITVITRDVLLTMQITSKRACATVLLCKEQCVGMKFSSISCDSDSVTELFDIAYSTYSEFLCRARQYDGECSVLRLLSTSLLRML